MAHWLKQKYEFKQWRNSVAIPIMVMGEKVMSLNPSTGYFIYIFHIKFLLCLLEKTKNKEKEANSILHNTVNFHRKFLPKVVGLPTPMHLSTSYCSATGGEIRTGNGGVELGWPDPAARTLEHSPLSPSRFLLWKNFLALVWIGR